MQDQKTQSHHSIRLAGGLFTLFLTFPAASQVGGNYGITKNTIDGGGGISSGGEYSVTGTVGQPDAGVYTLAGGKYKLAGGFWAAAGDVKPDLIFSNSFESD